MNDSVLIEKYGCHPLLQTAYDRIALLKYCELDRLVPSLNFGGCARTYLGDLLERLGRFTDGRKERFLEVLEATADMEPWKETLDRIRSHCSSDLLQR